MDTATEGPCESTPLLVDESSGMHQGEGYGNGKTREEKENYEWYNNFDSTYTMKKVVWIKTTKSNEENIHIHKIIVETITEKEYFKRKLAGKLYST